MWTAFDYMYRDAGNFKAFGTVMLEGPLSLADRNLIRSRLSSGEFFIAEQVGIPPLYGGLHKWSDGPTTSDHCWHEFVGFQTVAAPQSPVCVIDSNEFVQRFVSLHQWDEALSPHFDLSDVG